ncbi:signal peptidase, endoplasmic reticulum-type [Natronorubrum sediminis]|uniref:Signal peptidase, endoplasmic reticulum-type n=1 Tax=Natronorubrum sediminis TaxID=640943 RepID=A0A1H6G5K7_9EURY|nr:S26 family signal peptidase [Natronorubrum sediminis]SEH17613.1 signal peptidase, endoplasmic reticulum-type [Natronorubrum sediminis]
MSGPNPGDSPDDPPSSDDNDGDWTHRRDDAGNDTAEGLGMDNQTNSGDRVTIEDDGIVHWFLKAEEGNVVFARDILSSVAIVAVIGLLLFAFSGIWPPLVAVESGSMEPNMERGDLIFVIDQDRFVGDDPAGDTGIVPLEDAEENGHERFDQPGDVIVFQPNGEEHQTPIIHRAHFWVEEGENWVDTKADDDIIGDTSCDDIDTCPAQHDGFITKGDANEGYDQQYGAQEGQSDVVKSEWVTGKARFGIPWLGHIRLTFDSILGGMLAPGPVIDSVPASDSAVAATQLGIAGTTGAAGAAGGVGIALKRYRD